MLVNTMFFECEKVRKWNLLHLLAIGAVNVRTMERVILLHPQGRES